MSRQTDWQARKRADGLCTICGNRAAIKRNGKTASKCLPHLIEQREYIRDKLGSKNRYTVTDSYAAAKRKPEPKKGKK